MVLFGQNLGWRHERCLFAVCYGHQHGCCCDYCLTRTDVTLQHPAHGAILDQVVQYLFEAVLLGSSKGKGQRSHECIQHGLIPGQWNARLRPPLLALAQHAQLDHEKLVERQAAAGLICCFLAVGKVDLAKGGRQIHQTHFDHAQLGLAILNHKHRILAIAKIAQRLDRDQHRTTAARSIDEQRARHDQRFLVCDQDVLTGTCRRERRR